MALLLRVASDSTRIAHHSEPMELRQRRSQAGPPPAPSTVVESIRSLDFNPKTLDDFKERTGSGAAVSIVSVCVIFLLVVSELRSYLTPVVSDHLYVDTTRGERIRINVNITFPSMPCAGLKCAQPFLLYMRCAALPARAIPTGRRLAPPRAVW